MPAAESPQAEAIIALSAIVFAVAALIFIAVEGALLAASWRFRERDDGRAPSRVTGHVRLEIAWTVVPFLLLAVVFVLMLGTMRSITAAPADALTVRVIGHQWWWEFRYGDVVTANELRLPAGRAVSLELTSGDVIHAFWVPELGGKRDAIPDGVQHLTLTPRREGVYRGACAEFCGTQHAWMLLRVVVESPEAFAAWLEAERRDAAPPSTAQEVAGQGLLLSNTCVNCHAIRGTNANGMAGPDLTHFGRRATIGAGVAPNEAEHLGRWVNDAQSMKPGALMPPYRFSAEQVAAIVAYLRSLR